MTSQPESKLTARLFLWAKQARERGKEVADRGYTKLTVVWPILEVLPESVLPLLLKRNTIIFLECKKSERKWQTVAATIEIHPSSWALCDISTVSFNTIKDACLVKGYVVGKGRYDWTWIWMQTQTQTFWNTFLHLYNNYYSYLLLYIWHHSPSRPRCWPFHMAQLYFKRMCSKHKRSLKKRKGGHAWLG